MSIVSESFALPSTVEGAAKLPENLRAVADKVEAKNLRTHSTWCQFHWAAGPADGDGYMGAYAQRLGLVFSAVCRAFDTRQSALSDVMSAMRKQDDGPALVAARIRVAADILEHG